MCMGPWWVLGNSAVVIDSRGNLSILKSDCFLFFSPHRSILISLYPFPLAILASRSLSLHLPYLKKQHALVRMNDHSEVRDVVIRDSLLYVVSAEAVRCVIGCIAAFSELDQK